MNKMISKYFKYSLFSALFLIALAILFIVQSAMTIVVIAYIIGALLIALGVQAELQFAKSLSDAKMDLNIIYGVVCVILGVIVISYPEAIQEIVTLVIGFIIVVSSAIKMQYSIELKKQDNKMWISTLILSIIMTICGVVLIINPFQGLELFLRIVGIFILVYAGLDLISTIILKTTFRKNNKIVNENIKEANVIEDIDEEENKKSKRVKNDD